MCDRFRSSVAIIVEQFLVFSNGARGVEEDARDLANLSPELYEISDEYGTFTIFGLMLAFFPWFIILPMLSSFVVQVASIRKYR